MMTDTLQLAKALISIESVTPNDNGCLELIAQRLQPLGFTTERIDSGAEAISGPHWEMRARCWSLPGILMWCRPARSMNGAIRHSNQQRMANSSTVAAVQT